jgi:sugar lactone lactonase YvrE
VSATPHLATCRQVRARLLLVAITATAAALAANANGANPTLDIFTVAGTGAQDAGDGAAATAAALDGPAGLAAAPTGAIFVADTIDQRIRVVDPTGRIDTLAGNGKRGFSGDGGPARAATFQDPTALALGADGSLYVTDTGNNRLRVVRPDHTVATVAGTADQGFSGDGGQASAAQLNAPAGVTTDSQGHIFLADTGNNRVREIAPDGTITTIAGTGQQGFAGDGGPATKARLNSPSGLALMPDGSLLIADTGNNRVRRVASDGTISTVAGNGGVGSAGDGGPATSAGLNMPVDVAAPPGAGFFVAEQGGDRVRFVDPTGRITRVAGTGAPRFGGDGKPAASSFLNAPHAIALTAATELLIADSDNNRVRYVALPGHSTRLAVAPLAASVDAPLVKVKHGKRRVLVVKNVAIPVLLTKAATVTVGLGSKTRNLITRFKQTLAAGSRSLHLPARLRSGKHRLKKDHYVFRVLATSGSAVATARMELVVK